MNDYRQITYNGAPLLPEKILEEYEKGIKFLMDILNSPFDGDTVVVTHHLPSWKSCDPKFKGDRSNAFFASNLDRFVEISGAKLWIHGHTHVSCDYKIGETRVVCNPRGYFINGQPQNPEFDPNLVITI